MTDTHRMGQHRRASSERVTVLRRRPLKSTAMIVAVTIALTVIIAFVVYTNGIQQMRGLPRRNDNIFLRLAPLISGCTLVESQPRMPLSRRLRSLLESHQT